MGERVYSVQNEVKIESEKPNSIYMKQNHMDDNTKEAYNSFGIALVV